MIAPRARLLWVFGALVLPALALLSYAPQFAAFLLVLIAAVLTLAAVDAFLSRRRFDGLQLTTEKLVRFSKDRAGAIPLRWENTLSRSRQLRFALDLPAVFQMPAEELQVEVPADRAVTLSWECTPVMRGKFVLERILAEIPSPLGLWRVRRNFAADCELRVYPDLLSERQSLAAIFLHRGDPGSRAIRRVGKGREFEQLRDYIFGDSAEDVHWKATAKRGRPVTKVFQVERTQEVYVVIDASRLSARRADGTPMLERFINCALILCLAAAQRSDLFGLTTFSHQVKSFVRARNGKAHYDLCRDTLYRLQPEAVTPAFDDLFTFLRLRLRRRALLVFLTALDDPALAAEFTDKIELLSRQHVVLVNMPRPPEAQALFETSPVQNTAEIYRRLAGHLVWHDLRELGRKLQQHGVRFSLVEHARLTSEVVSQYLEVKQRQLI